MDKLINTLFNMHIVYWLLVISYFVVAYIIGVFGVQVFNKCPLDATELEFLGGGKSTATASLTLNSISIVCLAACWIMVRCMDCSPIDLFSEVYKKSDVGKALSVFTIIILLAAVIVTAVAEFNGASIASQCKLIPTSTQEEIDDFRSASDTLNRVYGVVIIAIIFAFFGLVYVIKEQIKVSQFSFGKRK
jgi:hypothetical protein